MLQEARRLDPILIMTTSPALIVYPSQLLEQNDNEGEQRGVKNSASQSDSCHFIIKLWWQLRPKQKEGPRHKSGEAKKGIEWRENVKAGSFNRLQIASERKNSFILCLVVDTLRQHPIFVQPSVSGSHRSETNSQTHNSHNKRHNDSTVEPPKGKNHSEQPNELLLVKCADWNVPLCLAPNWLDSTLVHDSIQHLKLTEQQQWCDWGGNMRAAASSLNELTAKLASDKLTSRHGRLTGSSSPGGENCPGRVWVSLSNLSVTAKNWKRSCVLVLVRWPSVKLMIWSDEPV